jgi:hypothetical protein
MREICTSGSTRGRWATDLFCYPPSYSTGPMFFACSPPSSLYFPTPQSLTKFPPQNSPVRLLSMNQED